jgi:outer membrane lipoprotein-sorting protein
MTTARLLALLAAIGAGAHSLAQGLPDKDALLDAVVRANQDLKFKGIRTVVFRFERDGRAATRKFVEVIVRDGEKVRTEYTGDEQLAGQIAVDDGKNRWHYLPKENVINRSPSLQHQSSERLEMLMQERRKEYAITVAEGGRIAEKSTYLITLKSERGFTHKIWVEKERKAILRRDFQGPYPDRGSSYEFESFDYRRRIDSDNFRIEKPGARVLGPEDRLALAAKKIEYAPYAISDPKFLLYDSATYEATSEKVKVLRSIYGDGKLVVTLHQFRGSIDPDRFKRREDTRTRLHVWKEDGYNFVLVGDLPASELERLARLVRR